MRVVSDAAERGAKLVTDYSQILTENEEELQLLLQVVEEPRNKFPDMKKSRACFKENSSLRIWSATLLSDHFYPTNFHLSTQISE